MFDHIGDGVDDVSAAVACFGEIMLRLSPPGRQLPLQSPSFDVHVGGAEANVAVGLASLGHAARMISALPPGPLGDAALAELRRRGVETAAVARGEGRLGLYYLIAGAGVRASEVIYDRDDSAFSTRRAEEWDWDAALEGCGRLHLSGITPALGPRCAAAALAATQAATARGVPISFDGNYRARLWQRWGGDSRKVLRRIVATADLLFGDHRDVGMLLDRHFDDGPDRARAAAEAAFDTFPKLRLIASTERRTPSADHQLLSARVDERSGEHRVEEVDLSGVVDRIGAGDAFAAGVLHGLATTGDPAAAARDGLTLACLKHSLPGDASLFTTRDLAAFQAGGMDVRR